MAANKNAVKIGLRFFAAVTLIYLVYHLIPTSSYPLRSNHQQPPPKPYGDIDFVKEGVHTAAASSPPSRPSSHHTHEESAVVHLNPSSAQGDSHVSTPTKAASAKVIPTSPPTPLFSLKPSKWASTTYTDPLLPTPIKHITLTNNEVTTSPNLLVCVMTKDAESWGGKSRGISSFLSMIQDTGYSISNISLALLTSSQEEYEAYQAKTNESNYASVHIILHSGYQNSGASRGNRHDNGIQHARRVEMARLRNYATLTSLQLSHQHVLWIDADVWELSPGLVQNMLGFSEKYPQAAILTALSHPGTSDGDYDYNAWQGQRSSPNDQEREKLRGDKGSWVAGGVNGKSKHMGDLRNELKKLKDKLKKLKDAGQDFENGGAFDPNKAVFDEEEEEPADSQASTSKSAEGGVEDIEGLFRLDAVGATVLMMKASLWRQGLTFATSYLVGTDWRDEGWDGVESEGLCMSARNLINEEYGHPGGQGCWGLAEGWSRHSSS